MTNKNNDIRKYDSIIIGSGQSGTPLAFDLAKRGQSVALIEKNLVGGSCVNSGCTPTKTLIASSNLFHRVQTSSELGVDVSDVALDFKKVMKRKDEIVGSSRGNIEKNIEEDENIDLYRGLASFENKDTVTIDLNDGGNTKIKADTIYINAGSKSNIIPIDGLDSVDYYDSTSILELNELPDHLVIIGTSYIALEFGQMFKRFGSKVTMIGRGNTILNREDEDISNRIQEILEEDGVEFILNADTKQVEKDGDSVSLSITVDDGEKSLSCSHLMLATGRIPTSSDLNLQNADVKVDDHGNIQVDDKLKTSTDNIYAIGDIKGGPQFTHISYDDFRVIINNLYGDKSRDIKDRLVPFTLYVEPQLGRIGLTENQAIEKGYDIKVAKLEMSTQGRPKEENYTKGFLKAVINKENDTILGAAMLGYQGGELMALIEIAMMGNLTYDKLRDGIFSHPSLSEILNNLFDI